MHETIQFRLFFKTVYLFTTYYDQSIYSSLSMITLFVKLFAKILYKSLLKKIYTNAGGHYVPQVKPVLETVMLEFIYLIRSFLNRHQEQVSRGGPVLSRDPSRLIAKPRVADDDGRHVPVSRSVSVHCSCRRRSAASNYTRLGGNTTSYHGN